MRRFTPLNVAAALVVTALAAALVATGSGAGAATQTRAGAPVGEAFRQALAAQLGAQLHKPAADVLAALKGAHGHRPAGARAQRRAARLTARADRLARRAQRLAARADALKGAAAARLGARADRLSARAERLSARAHAVEQGAGIAPPAGTIRARRAHARRDAWAAAVAQPLGLSQADMTAALRALVAARLDSLVHDGWLSSDRRAAELACFDDASHCTGMRRPPGLAMLRAGL